MSEGVDYSDSRPGGAVLYAAGKRFAVRYVPYGGYSKGLTKAEALDLLANGIDIPLVFESTADRMRDGYGAGVYDAGLCVSALFELGAPSTLPIYFGADFDTTPLDYTQIDVYLQGAASVLGLNRVGIYGEFDVLDHCRSAGLAVYFWQTYAWSGGRIFAYNHIFQYLNGVFINGCEVDLDASAVEFGQWRSNVGQPVQPDDDEDAVLVLGLFEQIVGVVPSTYTDDARVQAIRAQIAKLAAQAQTAEITQIVKNAIALAKFSTTVVP